MSFGILNSPAAILVDPALAARLVGVDAEGLLEGRGSRVSASSGTWLGALFESLVTQSVRAYAEVSEARVYHLRTKSTEHEIDLIVESHDRSVVAIEVKWGAKIHRGDTRHFRWLDSKLTGRLVATMIINTGPVAYTRDDGIHVAPLALLGA